MNDQNLWDEATPATVSVRYPNVAVPLTGESTNVRDIISRVSVAIQAEVSPEAGQEFEQEATVLADAGEFNMVLDFVKATVDTSGESAIGTCYYCNHPAVSADSDMCDYHENLNDDYLRHLNGDGW